MRASKFVVHTTYAGQPGDHEDCKCHVTVGRLGTGQFCVQILPSVRLGRVYRLEQGGVFVGSTGRRQSQRIDMSLKAGANSRVG